MEKILVTQEWVGKQAIDVQAIKVSVYIHLQHLYTAVLGHINKITTL